MPEEEWAGYDPACYMMANECEYWAEGSQAWFDATVRKGKRPRGGDTGQGLLAGGGGLRQVQVPQAAAYMATCAAAACQSTGTSASRTCRANMLRTPSQAPTRRIDC